MSIHRRAFLSASLGGGLAVAAGQAGEPPRKLTKGDLPTPALLLDLAAFEANLNTMAELGMGSLKCRIGKEENLLAGIPEIARKVAGRP